MQHHEPFAGMLNIFVIFCVFLYYLEVSTIIYVIAL